MHSSCPSTAKDSGSFTLRCTSDALPDKDAEDDDDDETCGFCRFMKAGGCKPEFTVRTVLNVQIAWQALPQRLALHCELLLQTFRKLWGATPAARRALILGCMQDCNNEVQAWSACVDANRGDGHNFTEECRDATLALQVPLTFKVCLCLQFSSHFAGTSHASCGPVERRTSGDKSTGLSHACLCAAIMPENVLPADFAAHPGLHGAA